MRIDSRFVFPSRLVSIEELYGYIRSLIRRYRSMADSVLQATTSDNVRIVLKMFAVTKGRTTHMKLIGLGKEMDEIRRRLRRGAHGKRGHRSGNRRQATS